MKIIDILKEMKNKGFNSNASIDLYFKDESYARCRMSDFFPAINEYPKLYTNMNGKLTNYYSIKDMLEMNLIVIKDVK